MRTRREDHDPRSHPFRHKGSYPRRGWREVGEGVTLDHGTGGVTLARRAAHTESYPSLFPVKGKSTRVW